MASACFTPLQQQAARLPVSTRTQKRRLVCNASRILTNHAVGKPVSQVLSLRLTGPNRSFYNAKKPTHVCKVAETSYGHKLISRAEVPAFIMRDDLIDQLYRWTCIQTGEDCVRNFGLPMSVETIFKEIDGEDALWGFTISVFKEGEKLAELAVRFDDDNALKHEWLDRGSDGMPVAGGKGINVPGKNLEIWKVDNNPVDEDLRSALRAICTNLMGAMNKYYSFGSVFAEDL